MHAISHPGSSAPGDFEPAPRSPDGWGSGVVLPLIIFVVAGLLNNAAYGSAEPMLLALLPFLLVLLLLSQDGVGGRPEVQTFRLTFSVYWLMAGVAAVFANQLGDPFQLGSDAALFYSLASGHDAGLWMPRALGVVEGLGAIYVWERFYEFVEFLGLQKERYAGILINVTAVSLAGVFGIKVVRELWGEDNDRFGRFRLLVATCGMFWLFAGIHVRDGLILLVVTALVFVVVQYMKRPSGARMAAMVAALVVSSTVLALLRFEFGFLPFAIVVAAVTAQAIGKPRHERKRRSKKFTVVVGVAVAVLLFISLQAQLLDRLLTAYEGYQLLTMEETAGSESIGAALIVEQPLPIRLLPGLASLYLFPVPLWRGFQLESAYHLFKACNALFFYFIVPLACIGIAHLWTRKTERVPAILFVLFLWLGTALAVAGTSLEARHAAAFYVPMFVIALIPDLGDLQVRRLYRASLTGFLLLMVGGHIAWLFLKL